MVTTDGRILSVLLGNRTNQEPISAVMYHQRVNCVVTHVISLEERSGLILEVNSTIPAWKLLLELAIGDSADAIIDTGALLAGCTNIEAAEYLVGHPSFGKKGVVYFDIGDSETDGQWMVMDRDKMSVEKSQASISEKNAFVIFDDARTRGADMQMKSDAWAYLTIGPRLTKTKLVQGAGRMRMLETGNQCLRFVYTNETAQELSEIDNQRNLGSSSGISVANVLKWVLQNTEQENANGLEVFFAQAIEYMKSPEGVAKKEEFQLIPMYDKIRIQQTWHEKYSSELKTLERPHTADVHRLHQQFEGFQIFPNSKASNHTEETEREIHVLAEKNIELPKRTVFEKKTAFAENNWQSYDVWNVTSVDDFRTMLGESVSLTGLSDYTANNTQYVYNLVNSSSTY